MVIVYSLQRDSCKESSISPELKHCSGGRPVCEAGLSPKFPAMCWLASPVVLALLCVGPAEVYLMGVPGDAG